jgi:hypothetical protein
MLRQLGASVTWDQNTYSVNVTLTSNSISKNYKSIDDIAKEFKNKNIINVVYVSDGESVRTINFYYAYGIMEGDENSFNSLFMNTMLESINTNATTFRFVDKNYAELSLSTDHIKDYANGKITEKELYDTMLVKGLNSKIEPSPVASTKEYPVMYSNDGAIYLGKLTSNEFDSDSIFNEFGSYGGKFSEKSIFNEFGTYGGKYSDQSPFNEYASKPPVVIENGKVTGHLTINTAFKDAISPVGLKESLKNQGF